MSIDQLREGRSLYILIPLLLLNVTLLSIQIEDPTGTTLFKKWIIQTGAPFLNLSSSVSRTTGGIWTGYVWLRGARAENATLHERLRQLTLRDYALTEVKAENERLRRLLDLKANIPLATIGARVVARTPDYLANVVYIDRGSEDGVQTNAPVLSASGVLGKTIVVSFHNAQVQLLTNPSTSVGAMVERTRTPGVISGKANPLLELNYLNNSEPVEVNDTVVTSGLDGIFPRGIPIGRVVESRKGKTVFRHILVEPVTDLVKTEEVLVLLGSAQVR